MTAAPAYERMTAMDASFLHAETARTPLHVGALSIFEGAPFFDERGAFRLEDVRDRVAERLHLFPRFRKRVATVPFGQGRPVWVDDEAFDIANHVRLMVLPEPGNRDELEALCDRLQMQLLDRAHPLWELWFIGGLDDGNIAMVEKVHHAMVDGVSGVDVAAALLDLEREPAPIEVPDWHPTPAPDDGVLLVESLLHRISEPVEWVRTVRALLRTPNQAAARFTGIADGLMGFLRPDTMERGSSLNRQVGMHRRLGWVTEPLADVKATAHRFDATVNDVVLAAVAGGLRDLVEHRGENVEHLRLRSLVPVSVRADHEHLSLGNRVSGMLIPLPTDHASARDRLKAAHASMVEHKARHQSEGAELLLEGIELLPPGLLSLAARSIHSQPLINIVVTNVPGPQFPLYFLGAEMLESVPIVPLGGNLTIALGILSYNGQLIVAAFADAETNEDLPVLINGIEDSFAELSKLATEAV